jgi:hypothetical protein
MKPSTIYKALLVLLVALLIINLYTFTKMLDYRDRTPAVKVQVRQSHDILYGRFNPDRSNAYTCDVQKKVSSDGVGMICTSPDDNITINCTVTSGNPSQYFC